MQGEEVKSILMDTGALLEGHFLLTSGKHGGQYCQCARLFEYPAQSAALCENLAAQLGGVGADLVVGPAVGGVIMAYELARALGARAMFAERENGVMTLRRNFIIPQGARVVVSEDVITTGGTVREVMDVVRAAGGEVAAVAVIVDRSRGKADFGAPLVSTLTLELPAYDPEECPICAEGLPLVKPGSRARRA